MTSNAIAAMRLQEEKRHNRETEDEAKRERKSSFASGIIGSIARGLGTGVLTTFAPKVQAARTLTSIMKTQKKGRK